MESLVIGMDIDCVKGPTNGQLIGRFIVFSRGSSDLSQVGDQKNSNLRTMHVLSYAITQTIQVNCSLEFMPIVLHLVTVLYFYNIITQLIDQQNKLDLL